LKYSGIFYFRNEYSKINKLIIQHTCAEAAPGHPGTMMMVFKWRGGSNENFGPKTKQKKEEEVGAKLLGS
jgi:hypothetical protein